MDPISLTVKSPKVALPGLDHLIERMERADELITKLTTRSQAPIRVRFAVSGDEALQVAATNLQGLENAFRSIGELRIADNLSKGLITPGEAAGESAREIDKLRLKFKQLTDEGIAAEAKYQTDHGDTERFVKQRQLLERHLKARQELQDKIQGMERARGMAVAMSGGSSAAPKTIDATAAAERELAPAAQASAAALEQQDAIVRQKIAAMQGLTKATKGTAAAEREQARATGEAAQANQEGALLSQRIVRDQEGEELDRIRKMRTGPGQTLTTSNAGSVEATDLVQAHRRAFEQLDAEFGGRKAMLAEAGFEKGSAEQIELWRQEAAARRARVSAMQEEGLGAESLAEKQRTVAAALEQTAHAAESRNQRRATTEAEASSQASLSAGLRDQIALIDRQYEATRAVAKGELELAQATRQRAQEYRATVADVRAAEQMGGLGSDPGRESYLRGLETRAARLEADATRTETRLANVSRANAAAARSYEQQFAAFGGKEKRTRDQQTASGRSVTQVSVKEDPMTGVRESIELVRRFDAAGKELEPTLTRATNAMTESKRGVTAVGASFLRNVASVTTWSAAVATLYGTLGLLNFGLQSAIKFERQFATLQAVYRGTNEEALQLGATSLKLGSALGRSGEEANDAAVRWSRLGLMGNESAEAIAVSLQAANVAEITAAESAEHLSAIYASYRLEVGELRTVLNELNTVSNTLNVTNKDLLQGIARTGAIAKQAGIPLAELIGMIGTGVSRTGRSGAEIGNAIKSIIVAVSNPELQKTLQDVFGFDVKSPIGDLKDMSTIFDELYVKVQGLSNAARGELLQKIGGKQQASRLEALLDGYVTSQVKAIEAQKDLNSADREAELIRNTVVSQLQTMTTEWQRLFYVMLSVGGEQSALSTLRNLVSLTSALMGAGADSGSWLGQLARQLADIGGMGSSINTLAKWFGVSKASAPAETGIFNRQLEETKGQAGAAEMGERLATTLSKGIGTTARRDPAAARQALEEFASVTSENATERNLNREELLQLLEQNRLRQLENRLLEIGEGFGRRRLELRAKESQIIAGDIVRQQQVVADLQKEIGLKAGKGQDTRAMERQLSDARRELDRLKGAGQENLLKDYGDGEGFDPLETVKAGVKDRLKTAMDAQAGLFAGGVGDTETGKLDRKMQALAAEEAAIQRLEDSKSAPQMADLRPEANAAALAAQEQLNVAIDAEVAARREALAAEREKVGIQREAAQLQDQIAAGAREGRNRIIGMQVGRNDTEQNLAEVEGIRKNVEAILPAERQGPTIPPLPDRLRIEDNNLRIAMDPKSWGESEEDFRRQVASGAITRDNAEHAVVDFKAWPTGEKAKIAASRSALDDFYASAPRPSLGTVTGLNDPAKQGEAIAYGNRLLEIQAGLAERRHRLERDITNARAAQNAETSKALSMATREDQLRAALLAKFTQQNGAISAEQFQFLDQDTRQAAQKFVPDASPGAGGKAQELEAEKALLDGQFEQVNATIKTLLDGLKAVDPGLLLGKGAGAGAAPAPPQITAPNVTFNMGAQFEEMTKGLYALAEGRIEAEVQSIQAQVNAFLGSQRLSGAQASGASSINS